MMNNLVSFWERFKERGGFLVEQADKIRVLFICMGNICRSPSAEWLFRHKVEQAGLSGRIEIASVGTHDYHVGGLADKRSAAAALSRGVDLSLHRAQHLKLPSFEKYDYLLVMDTRNYEDVMALCPPEYREKVAYFLDFAEDLDVREVPDPYYGGPDGFETVLDLLEAASIGFLAHIREEHPELAEPNIY
jgi:protein-tyrosine phosphatase